ncbi:MULTISPECIES: hypothetical protein [Streptomyces]|uniref:hypothetical protein n=1 Tax=Streptomyces TaxID=1883 RepID=UPI00131DD632|nr:MULTISPECIES: hypothetical protein [Streptomyces]MBE4736531.1 hypothetical protein [Streptomyces caniscabiei]MBE4760761.1 hypothetical protein [Streptomyces caniscabiei]MBE4770455.1 hypothetical protein [Streptomyces caniscabiei]MDX2983968.1 hypothetical protein [Streptomyces caniscabiei]MDX3010828.1 hypothetical protein [Streptomyces caniscabiei]
MTPVSRHPHGLRSAVAEVLRVQTGEEDIARLSRFKHCSSFTASTPDALELDEVGDGED